MDELSPYARHSEQLTTGRADMTACHGPRKRALELELWMIARRIALLLPTFS